MDFPNPSVSRDNGVDTTQLAPAPDVSHDCHMTVSHSVQQDSLMVSHNAISCAVNISIQEYAAVKEFDTL